MEGSAKKAACLNLGKQRCCVAFFSLSIVSECLGRREVLAFFALLLSCGQQEWPSGKPEWAGRGVVQQHQVSQYFLHRCLLFVYLQNKRHGHLFLSPWISSRSSLRFSFVRRPLPFKVEFIFDWRLCTKESTEGTKNDDQR